MGLGPNWSSSSYDENGDSTQSSPNPDPQNCIIERFEQKNNHLLVEIHYPTCTNYEGKKVLLYQGITLKALQEQQKIVGIDPHFSNNPNYLSPIARFEPTQTGWAIGLSCMK